MQGKLKLVDKILRMRIARSGNMVYLCRKF